MFQRVSILTGLCAVLGLTFGTQVAESTSVRARTLVDLIELSEMIVLGDVRDVRDGFDASGVPFTEITLDVGESVRGSLGAQYTFRQFGLLEPRQLADGTWNLNVSPDGWPRFHKGERVVLFLHPAGELTGLRTTTGLFQGKFTVDENGMVANLIGNQGLFKGVRETAGRLSPVEQKMLAQSKGGIQLDTFLGLVRKAVQERWVEDRRLVDDNN